jgi:hypothetical protein
MSAPVACGQCNAALDERSDLPPDQRPPCPYCGSMARAFSVTATGGIVPGVDRGQARPEDLGADLQGDWATIEVATAGAAVRVSLVLCEDRRQLEEFGHLMPGRPAVERTQDRR